VLDTGAPDLSIIDNKIVKEMKLRERKTGNLKGAGKSNQKFSFLENTTLSLPGIKITDARLGTFSMAFMEPYWGKPKFGLLGGNILSKVITEIDYVNKYVTFYSPDNYINQGISGKIPINIKENTIVIKAVICISEKYAPVTGRFIIDTAVRNSFFNSPFTKKFKFIERSEKIIENITGFGIGGEGFGKLGRVNYIQIGNNKISAPVIEFTTDTKGISASKEFDGIIGADILSRFNVVIDYTREEMRLTPNKNFSKPFEYDKSGLYFIKDDQHIGWYKIAYVIKNSPAAKAGIYKGDVLIEIDGKNTSHFNYEQIKNLLKKDEKIIKIKILHNNVVKNINLKPEKLI
jgi:hypothetical protein